MVPLDPAKIIGRMPHFRGYFFIISYTLEDKAHRKGGAIAWAVRYAGQALDELNRAKENLGWLGHELNWQT
ncbi:hypothetical protein Pla22_20660 [Rubripirellula amarantea]|uniref:Uncharacterized protein n=1 Tax=Rubripirellula amarantea TaxID=2527999 RepID=A0A5C5WVY3_9BACT|nr:hypothetical protein Pla22_20660 [Rubripirellula amarantea]